MNRRARFGSVLVALCLAVSASVYGDVIVDDSWADGTLNNGADPLDTSWWTSSSTSAIEITTPPGGPNTMGLVTGTSGRGIHTVFPTQTLANVGDKIVATYTFTTPTNVGTGGTGAFRVGMFDTLGRAGLDADVASSSGSPNALYGWVGATPPTAALPGYMLDMDVGTGTADLSFRQHDTTPTATTPTGRLMGTTSGFTQLSPTGPDGAYAFAANTTYTGSLTIERLNATQVRLTGTLGAATHSVDDTFDSADVGMLAFWANSNMFGSSPDPNMANNGIDFSNVKIEFIAVPEPASLSLLALGLVALTSRRRRS